VRRRQDDGKSNDRDGKLLVGGDQNKILYRSPVAMIFRPGICYCCHLVLEFPPFYIYIYLSWARVAVEEFYPFIHSCRTRCNDHYITLYDGSTTMRPTSTRRMVSTVRTRFVDDRIEEKLNNEGGGKGIMAMGCERSGVEAGQRYSADPLWQLYLDLEFAYCCHFGLGNPLFYFVLVRVFLCIEVIKGEHD
jgi:hypothetical protein